MEKMKQELEKIESAERLQRYLDALDFEPPRKPYASKGRCKIRDSIRLQIKNATNTTNNPEHTDS